MRNKGFFLTLVMAVAFLACAHVPRVGDKDRWAAPLPNDINIIAPSPDLPKELAAFLAKWGGHFEISGKPEYFREGVLVVQEIGLQEARIIYSVGAQSGVGGDFYSKPIYWRIRAKVIHGKLPKIEIANETGGRITWSMNKDLKTLSVLYQSSSGIVIRTKMFRID